MKTYIAAAFLSALVALFSFPAQAENATVKVSTDVGSGSGVYIADNTVLTAAHVVRDAKTVTVKTQDGLEVEGVVRVYDIKKDIATVYLKDKLPVVQAVIDCRTPIIGEYVEAIGNPYDIEFMHTWGRIGTKLHKLSDDKWDEVVIVDITFGPGMSGGPVYSDNKFASSKVVGIIVGAASTIPLGIIVPASTVCKVIGATS